jgi:DNA repair exonuclease SbcCD ATPase subunit
MEEYQEQNQETNPEANQEESQLVTTPAGWNRWLVIVAVLFLVVAGVAFGYGYRQQIAVGHLTAQESVANATIDRLQGQLDTVTARMNDMAAAQQAAAQAAEKKKAQAGANAHSVTKRSAPVDKRYKQLQAQLEEQQKQLKETQDLVARNRTDLEGSLGSTKDELNGSIAKTHEELVALQKRGERNYFEFDLNKSKQFQRVGPLTLSLRHADTKHMNYDVNMMVDDNQLSKKRVNLYEPIWVNSESEGQSVQVVVNKISKNFVHGYISAPKYKAAELASAGAATVTPVSAHPQTPEQNQPNSENPRRPE